MEESGCYSDVDVVSVGFRNALRDVSEECGGGAFDDGESRRCPGVGSADHNQASFCEDCADKYFASMPGMNASRDLIQLSDRYRSKLYDLLEVEHPEVFQRGDNDHLFECANIMGKFLFEQLKREGVELNEGGFGMLLGGFIGSAEYYERCDRREGGA